MKTATKVFLILSMISAVLYIIYAFAFLPNQIDLISEQYIDELVNDGAPHETIEYMKEAFNATKNLCYVSGVLVPLIVGIIGGLSLYKLDTVTDHRKLVTLGVLTLIFVSIIPGILMLLIKDEDLANNRKNDQVL